MRVCDKCGEKANFIFSVDHQLFDLCKEHQQKLLEFLTEEPKRRGRPRNLENIQ
jgi:hypothetical protein